MGRNDSDLFDIAEIVGAVHGRSASQQVAHWARIGREIEASRTISARDVGRVLAGSQSYETLGPEEQAVVRARWEERIEELRSGLDLAERFADQGRSAVELDEDGTVVERG